MPRPRKFRKVCRLPENNQFGPIGCCCPSAPPVILTVDEYEAVRLIDLEGMTQQECAEKMHIVRTSVQAMYAGARKKLAELLVNGKRLVIEGGDYRLCEGGPQCGRGCRRFGRRPDQDQGANSQNAPCRGRGKGEETMQLIAISSEGPALADMVDPRFGRAAGFVIVSLENGQFRYLDNGSSQVLSQGAGIETASRLSREGVQVVLSGFVGPKAFQALQAAGIKICQDVKDMTVGEALEKFRAGQFPYAQSSNR